MKPKIVIILGAMAIAATVSFLVSSSIVEAYAQGFCPCHRGSGGTWVCHMSFPCKRVGPNTIQCRAAPGIATPY